MKRDRPRRVLFVKPFLEGSHRAFLEGWRARSRHRFHVIALPGGRWKWRLRAAAFQLARRVAAAPPCDVVVCSSMLDAAHLRALAGPAATAPWLVYWHENQFSYPRPPGRPLERTFAVAHVATLLAAEGHAFNSRAHRRALRRGLSRFLEELPPPRPRGLLSRLDRTARVLPPGVDCGGFPVRPLRPAGEPPVVLWNHRWEEDKRPGAFARVMLKLAREGLAFRLVLLGTTVQARPRPLELLRERLGERILRAGPVRDRRSYVRWLSRADLAVSTAAQENFGYAVVEAMAAGAVPLLPDRLSYPELLTPSLRPRLLYRNDGDLERRLAAFLRNRETIAALRPRVVARARAQAWERRVPALDEWVAEAAGHAREGRREA